MRNESISVRSFSGISVLTVCALIAALSLLAACGGSSPNAMNNPPPPPPTAQGDPFVVSVQAEAATAPDTAEPNNIDVLVTTAPEDKEPDPIT
jgi:uncharacterized protein YggE